MENIDTKSPNHRILYVDDENALLYATQRYFQQEGGLSIDTAGSADEGFRKIGAIRYDAIVSDFEMPDMNGIEFLSALRSGGNNTPFIIFTGKGREEVVIDAFNAGADYYLQKGGHPKAQFAELSNSIQKAIENRKVKDEIREKNAEIEEKNRELTKKTDELRRNLDELEKSRNQLQESEQRARSLLDSSISTIVLLDRNGIVLDANDGYPARFGKKRVDIIGTKVWDLFPDAIRKQRSAWLKQVFLTGKPFKNEVSWDGIWDYSIDPVFDTDGTVKSVTIHATDITQRKQMEDEIRTSETLYRTVVEDQTEFVCRFLPDGTHVFINDAYCRYFGKTRQKLMRAKFRPDIPKEDLMRITKMLQTLTPAHPVETIENRIVMPDGTIRWQQWSDRAIFDKNGSVMEYQSVGRDITEIKNAENAILAANNKLNLLSSITRHDILNQLTALLLLEEFLKEDITEEQPSSYVDAIIDVTNKIEEQIQFTRDYQDLGHIKPAWQDLRIVADQAGRQSLSCNIRTDIDVNGVFVYADLMLEKVFQNLYDNAIRHGETATHIRISFRNDGATGIITVADDGIGVPTNKKQKIFDRYTGSNTGLGLFLVSEILAITEITIRENGVFGEGSSFEILIPEGKWRRDTESVPDLQSGNT
ncbi:hybrid sensor histidine kinase/response regulator [Methanogenium organophilum]|uniref:histidine kinase n=1 Tax=Methanogenium organophilum TaxID=2199 RepID=A0A9X9S3Z3_METOG|nr:PAS domain S-box protein [Methanogenium organophilum]WAI00470.1 PAS domain S-box protein [Methanogenium organophilum]